MSYKEVFVGLNNENIERLADDFVETQPTNDTLRFCKVLNAAHIKKQYIKRQHKFNNEINRTTKKQGKLIWLSKMPISYFKKHGHWGDSKGTYSREKDGYIFSLKPGYELV